MKEQIFITFRALAGFTALVAFWELIIKPAVAGLLRLIG